MRVEGYVFTFVAIFLGISTAIYWLTSHDPTGTTALALATMLAVLIGSYAIFTARRTGPRYEDRVDAEIEEGAGEIAFFSPHSWWPLAAAFSAAFTAAGWVFGWWMFVIGVGMLLGSAAGFILEYYISPYHEV
jgi:hypothetical protein